MAFLALVSDLITEVQARVPEAAFSTWVTPVQLINWINIAQWEIVKRTSILERISTFTLTKGIPGYTLPLDFWRLKQREDSSGLYVNGNNMDYRDVSDALEFDLTPGPAPQAPPKYVWVERGLFWIYPVTDSAYAATVHYFRTPAILTVTTDTIDLGPTQMFNTVVVSFLEKMAVTKDKSQREQLADSYWEKAISVTYSEGRTHSEGRPRSTQYSPDYDEDY